MKFWDTSAFVPLFVSEETTPAIREVFAADNKVILGEPSLSCNATR